MTLYSTQFGQFVIDLAWEFPPQNHQWFAFSTTIKEWWMNGGLDGWVKHMSSTQKTMVKVLYYF